jgi:hypothetical protein
VIFFPSRHIREMAPVADCPCSGYGRTRDGADIFRRAAIPLPEPSGDLLLWSGRKFEDNWPFLRAFDLILGWPTYKPSAPRKFRRTRCLGPRQLFFEPGENFIVGRIPGTCSITFTKSAILDDPLKRGHVAAAGKSAKMLGF